MLSVYLIRMVETHAEELTKEVMEDLAVNPATPSFHSIPKDELRRRVYNLYHNLGTWLDDRRDVDIETNFATMGRLRHAEGVPLSECIFAVSLVKEHLRNYIRWRGMAHTALELYQEVELNLMLSHFFDRALYHLARGHEAAHRAAMAAVAKHVM